MALFDEYEQLLEEINAELNKVPAVMRGTINRPLSRLLVLLGKVAGKVDDLEARINAKGN